LAGLFAISAVLLAGCTSPVDATGVVREPSPSGLAAGVIDVDSQALLEAASGALEARGFQLTALTPSTNERILTVRGEDAGRQFLEESGRIAGWFADFTRQGDSSGPSGLQLNLILFRSARGPQLLMSEAGGPCRSERQPNLVLSRELSLGDQSALCIDRVLQEDESAVAQHWIPIAYQNVFVGLSAYIARSEAEALIDTAGSLLEALRSLPQIEGGTPVP
jgi:hypothetical protein